MPTKQGVLDWKEVKHNQSRSSSVRYSKDQVECSTSHVESSCLNAAPIVYFLPKAAVLGHSFNQFQLLGVKSRTFKCEQNAVLPSSKRRV